MKKLAIKLAGVALLALSSMGSALAQSEPIVFVHGYSGSNSNWDTMISRFRASGYQGRMYGFEYASLIASNSTSGSQLRTFVNNVRSANGNQAVSIIAHSNGGLVSRYYRVNAGGTSAMRRFVTLGSPHSGTTSAYACFSPACFDMRPYSYFLIQLAGRGCDRSLWSSLDGVILPATSARCGTSTQVASVSHLALLTDSSVYNAVRTALR